MMLLTGYQFIIGAVSFSALLNYSVLITATLQAIGWCELKLANLCSTPVVKVWIQNVLRVVKQECNSCMYLVSRQNEYA